MRHWGTLSERFWSRVNKHGSVPAHCPHLGICWAWTAGLNSKGYGTLSANGRKSVLASHVAWFLETGEWPSENALHRCDNPVCVRFSHLFQGTQADNVADMIKKDRARIRGKQNGQAVLTTKTVKLILVGLASGATCRSLANKYGVARQTVADIKRGKTWKHAR
jgi:hypothetical protein